VIPTFAKATVTCAAADGSLARAAVLQRYRDKKRRRGDGATVRYHMRQV